MVLGEYTDVGNQVRGAATALVTTPGGGRVAFVGYDGFNHVVSSARRNQLLSAADWVSAGRMPARVLTPAQVVPLLRVNADGFLRAVVLTNASIDHSPSLTVTCRGSEGRNTEWVSVAGALRLKPSQDPDRGWQYVVPAMTPWSIGYLRFA